MKPRTIVITVLVVVAILVAGFYALNQYIYAEKQGDGTVEAYRGTLSGIYVACLPQPATAATDACIPGLRIEDGSLYAIDFTLSSQLIEPPADGERMSAAGLITPIELLSSNHIRETGAVGVFSVTDSFKKE